MEIVFVLPDVLQILSKNLSGLCDFIFPFLGIGILISQTMLIQMLNEFVPYAHSEVPVLGTDPINIFIKIALSSLMFTF